MAGVVATVPLDAVFPGVAKLVHEHPYQPTARIEHVQVNRVGIAQPEAERGAGVEGIRVITSRPVTPVLPPQ